MFKRMLLIASAIGLSATTGMATDSVEMDNDLNELIEICRVTEANPQVRDFETVVTCRGHFTNWNLEGQNERPLDTEVVVRSELTMKGDRFTVPEQASQHIGQDYAAKCHTYKEYRYDYEPVSVTLTSCDEVQAIADQGRSDYCSGVLEQASILNPEGAETGRISSTCD